MIWFTIELNWICCNSSFKRYIKTLRCHLCYGSYFRLTFWNLECLKCTHLFGEFKRCIWIRWSCWEKLWWLHLQAKKHIGGWIGAGWIWNENMKKVKIRDHYAIEMHLSKTKNSFHSVWASILQWMSVVIGTWVMKIKTAGFITRWKCYTPNEQCWGW